MDIAVIKLSADKNAMEDIFRKLWRECFNDPAAYEEFYFNWVYSDNTVYAFGERGMLHLNPYSVVMGNEERLLHYIVGVGTKYSERRKGIMRHLLIQALQDMHREGEPFTYLMPADVRYYAPFGFVSVSEKKEHDLCGRQMLPQKQTVVYKTYTELLAEMEVQEREQLYKKIDSILSEHYAIYAKHDADYFELLYQEKSCQGGNVVFCFTERADSEHLLGFFAYGMDGAQCFIEQSVFTAEFSKDRAEDIMTGYQNLTGQGTLVERFPFMVRITNVVECMKLFPDIWHSFATDGKGLLIVDEEIPDNSGLYSIREEAHERIVKLSSVNQMEQDGESKEIITLSVAELTELLFTKISLERVYFAEVV